MPTDMPRAIHGRSRPCRIIGPSLLILAMTTGCSETTPVAPPVDAERGRAVLRDTLDAWKKGTSTDSLAGQSPPIRVADEDWVAGMQLVSYEIDPKDQVVGDVLRSPVALSLKDESGKSVNKRVYYNVATAPSPSVIRQD